MIHSLDRERLGEGRKELVCATVRTLYLVQLDWGRLGRREGRDDDPSSGLLFSYILPRTAHPTMMLLSCTRRRERMILPMYSREGICQRLFMRRDTNKMPATHLRSGSCPASPQPQFIPSQPNYPIDSCISSPLSLPFVSTPPHNHFTASLIHFSSIFHSPSSIETLASPHIQYKTLHLRLASNTKTL